MHRLSHHGLNKILKSNLFVNICWNIHSNKLLFGKVSVSIHCITYVHIFDMICLLHAHELHKTRPTNLKPTFDYNSLKSYMWLWVLTTSQNSLSYKRYLIKICVRQDNNSHLHLQNSCVFCDSLSIEFVRFCMQRFWHRKSNYNKNNCNRHSRRTKQSYFFCLVFRPSQ